MRTKEEAREELIAKVRAKVSSCCMKHLYHVIETLMDDAPQGWQVKADKYVFKRGPWAKWIERQERKDND